MCCKALDHITSSLRRGYPTLFQDLCSTGKNTGHLMPPTLEKHMRHNLSGIQNVVKSKRQKASNKNYSEKISWTNFLGKNYLTKKSTRGGRKLEWEGWPFYIRRLLQFRLLKLIFEFSCAFTSKV